MGSSREIYLELKEEAQRSLTVGLRSCYTIRYFCPGIPIVQLLEANADQQQRQAGRLDGRKFSPISDIFFPQRRRRRILANWDISATDTYLDNLGIQLIFSEQFSPAAFRVLDGPARRSPPPTTPENPWVTLTAAPTCNIFLTPIFFSLKVTYLGFFLAFRISLVTKMERLPRS